jgi:cytoskeletal protein CcmA (bactofilin family)
MPNDKDKPTQPAEAQAPPGVEDDSLDAPEPQAATTPAAGEPAITPAVKGKKVGIIKKFAPFRNMYLIVFALLVVAGGAVVYVSIKTSKKETNTTTISNLTDQQLASLKGSTTLVGDAKQTIDIQSNSIFEGQVLLRSDLNAAGSIKAGGSLSVTSISVGDSGTIGQLGINDGLKVGGDTTLQGELTVQKNLSVTGTASFGNLSVSGLSVTTLQLRGDLNLKRHIVTRGGNPSRNNGTALGGGGTASVGGSDTAGTITISTGNNPPAGCFITVNFVQAYSSTPHVIISPSNSSSAALHYYTNRSSTNFSVCTTNAPSAGTTYIFDYVIFH